MNKNTFMLVAAVFVLGSVGTGCVTSGYDTVYTTAPAYGGTAYGGTTYIETVPAPAYINMTVIDEVPPTYIHHRPPPPRPHAHHHHRPAPPPRGARPPGGAPRRDVRPGMAASRPSPRTAAGRSPGRTQTTSRAQARLPAAARPHGGGGRPRAGGRRR